MTVVCKCAGCGYYQNGFCSNPTVSINENGMCLHIYRRGQEIVPRYDAFEKVADEFKEKIFIKDAEGWINIMEEKDGNNEH